MLSDRFLLSARWIGSVVLVLSTMPNLWAQTATAPTASEDPVSIDQVWQKVSSKYDAKRQTVLSEVPDTIPGRDTPHPCHPNRAALESRTARVSYQE